MLDLKAEFERRVAARGGYVNCHGHFDRAFTLTQEDFFFGHRACATG